jgi:hypothetical protein
MTPTPGAVQGPSRTRDGEDLRTGTAEAVAGLRRAPEHLPAPVPAPAAVSPVGSGGLEQYADWTEAELREAWGDR